MQHPKTLQRSDVDDAEVQYIKEEPLDSSDYCFAEDCVAAQDGCVVIKDDPDTCDTCNDCSAKFMDFEVPPEEGGGLMSIEFDPGSDSRSWKTESLSKKRNTERQKIISAFREKIWTSPSKGCQLETTHSRLLETNSWEKRVGVSREKIFSSLDRVCNRELEKKEDCVPFLEGSAGNYMSGRGLGEKPSAHVQCFYIEGRLIFPEATESGESLQNLPKKLQESPVLGTNLCSTLREPVNIEYLDAKKLPENLDLAADETGSSANPVPTAMELETISTSAKQKRSTVSKIGSTHRQSNIESQTVPELASRSPEIRTTVLPVTNPAILVDKDNNHSTSENCGSKRKSKRNKCSTSKQTEHDEKGLAAKAIKRSQRQMKRRRIYFGEFVESEDELNVGDINYEPANKPTRGRGQHKRKRLSDSLSYTSTLQTPKPNSPFWEYNPTTGIQKYRGIEVRPCSVRIPIMTKNFLASYGVDLGDERKLVDLETLWRGMYPCGFCKFRTNSKCELIRHQSNHEKHYKPYQCSKCGYRSKYNQAVQLHLKWHHNNERPFQCAHCDHRASQKASLRQHIMTHFDDRPIVCPHCDYKCKTKSALRPHLIKHSGKRPYACPHCPYRANQMPHLKAHINFHLNNKPYACRICPFRARQSSHLNTHMRRIHSDEKPLKCDYCDFTCKGQNTLNIHTRSRHTGEKPFNCGLCAFRTAHPCLLTKHMKGHNEKFPHLCMHCSWSTDIPRAFKNHLSQWHPEKCAYHCDECGFSTVTKILLYNHKRKKHRY